MHELSSPGKLITFTNPVEAVQAEVDQLTQKGVNKIIVISHLGYYLDQNLAKYTTGVDVIIGGHSHLLLSNTDDRAEGPYPTMVGNTAIVQAEHYGKYLGELRVTFDDNGVLIKATGGPIILGSSVIEDETTVSWVADAAKPLGELLLRKVGYASEQIDGDHEVCRTRECSIGNLVADAMLAKFDGRGFQVAIINAGSMTASIDRGDITKQEVLKALPYRVGISRFQASGATILRALEHGVSLLPELSGRFPQVAGIKFTVDQNAPAGSRVSNVMVVEAGVFVPVIPLKVYGVVTTDRVRNGSEGYTRCFPMRSISMIMVLS